MKFVARNLQPSVLTLVADSGASAFSSKALFAWVAFCEAFFSPLHPTAQKTAQRFASSRISLFRSTSD
jgi:hypothetical protein